MVTQPSGEVMPQPVPAAEISCCVTGRGFPADADTLNGLFKYHVVNGVAGADMAMDEKRDAQIAPGTFSPQCGLTGTIVIRGGGCKNALGWYNATENPATKPAANQIYTLVPADLTQAPPNGLSCQDPDFCPLATHMTTQNPTQQHRWVDYDFAQNIRTSPNYKGGLIGLAMIGLDPQCPQTKYSQLDLNDKNAAGQPWISVLIYQSISDPQSYYVAFEDKPTCTASWKGCDTSGGNDGDFNDFVFFVSGLSCKTAGQPCTVPNVMGICAGGVTECGAGGNGTICRQTVKPAAEVCDAVDNDCDGVVDNGDNLCPAGQVCSQGVCRPHCDDTEFPCDVGTTCDNSDGLCKDPGCIGKTCGNEQVCRGGTCVGGCDGVTCPHGQRCIRGNCVTPCEGVTCAGGEVCEGGACQPRCDNMCRGCGTGTACDTTAASSTFGSCVETGCQNKTCPAGQVCVAGNCQDGCTGVVCPGGQACMNGSCTPVAPPDAGTPGTGGGGGFVIVGTGGMGGNSGTAGGSGPGTGNTSGGGGAAPPKGMINTCSCDVARGPTTAGMALLFVGVAIGIRRTRRARARSRSSR